MDARYRIRDPNAADLEPISAIERMTFSDPWSRTSLADELSHLALVAEDARGHVVGYIMARAAAAEGELRNLAIDPAHRGAGIGRELVEAVVRRMSERGVRTIYLEVRDSNRGARRFYQRLGFAVIGRRPRYYRRPLEDALIMVCCVRATGELASQ